MNQIYIKLYQNKFRGDDTKTYQIFGVPIDNEKTTTKVQFHPEAPVITYYQKLYNSCCLGILASAFRFIGDYRYVTALVNFIE